MDKIRIFICYAHEDDFLCKQLVKHLQMPGVFLWYDHAISAGMEWQKETDEQLKAAQIILLLVSPDFINSSYCNAIEMKALGRHRLGSACVIPVILRHVIWETTPIGGLRALPQNAEPVTSSAWDTLDQALLDVAKGVKEVVARLVKAQHSSQVVPALLSISDRGTGNSRGRTTRACLLPGILVVLIALVIISSGIGVEIYSQVQSSAHQTATFTAQANKTATAQINATATAKVAAYPSYLSGNGTLAFIDPLNQESGSKWHPFHNSEGGACQFNAGAYHVSQLPTGYYNWCRPEDIFSNFAFEVTLTITQGDCGGIVFRESGDGLNLYYYTICADGTYAVLKYSSHSKANVLQANSNSFIHAGLGRQNTIAVVANGSTMTFYANGKKIALVQDRSYASGHIGLLADPRSSGQTTDVAYTNARVWIL